VSAADGRSKTFNSRSCRRGSTAGGGDPGGRGTSESTVEDSLESGRGYDGDLGVMGPAASLLASDHSLDGC